MHLLKAITLTPHANASSATPATLPVPSRGRTAMLGHDEEIDLIHRWQQNGDEAALARLITAHGPLVRKLAKTFRGGTASPEDLLQEGMIGLIEAAKRFDPARGHRFATFAQFWVRALLLDYALGNWSAVGLGRSASHRRLFFRLRRLDAELAEFQGLDREQRDGVIAERCATSRDEVVRMRARLGAPDTSLDTPISAEISGAGTKMDALICEAPSPEDQAIRAIDGGKWRAVLTTAWKSLNDRERHVLSGRFLTDGRPKTLRELGEALGVSVERTRQIEAAALTKLRRLVPVG